MATILPSDFHPLEGLFGADVKKIGKVGVHGCPEGSPRTTNPGVPSGPGVRGGRHKSREEMNRLWPVESAIHPRLRTDLIPIQGEEDKRRVGKSPSEGSRSVATSSVLNSSNYQQWLCSELGFNLDVGWPSPDQSFPEDRLSSPLLTPFTRSDKNCEFAWLGSHHLPLSTIQASRPIMQHEAGEKGCFCLAGEATTIPSQESELQGSCATQDREKLSVFPAGRTMNGGKPSGYRSPLYSKKFVPQ